MILVITLLKEINNVQAYVYKMCVIGIFSLLFQPYFWLPIHLIIWKFKICFTNSNLLCWLCNKQMLGTLHNTKISASEYPDHLTIIWKFTTLHLCSCVYMWYAWVIQEGHVKWRLLFFLRLLLSGMWCCVALQ